MTNKKWITTFFIPIVLGMSFHGAINYTIDPLWTFSHSNKYNTKQNDFNERQQKTNHLYFNGLNKYEGILLGSSRSTFINQNDFINMKIYNYASNSMLPFEYSDYLNYAKNIKGQELKYIIIGADFYGSAVPQTVEFEKPSFYINQTQEFMYRYKLLLSRDNFKQSKKNYTNYTKGTERYYDRFNIKYQKKIAEEDRKNRYNLTIKKHLKTFSDDVYLYDKNYIKILKKIKEEHPTTKFIIFTSPVTANLLIAILKDKHKLKEYKRWLKEIIEVFGEVHHFMTINSITTNLQNYPDDDHYYPHIAKLLANKLSNHKNSEIPDDFGIILNKNNFDSYFKNFKKKLNKLN